MPDLHDIAERLSNLTVIEAAELAKLLEEKWGVSAAAPVVQTTTALVQDEKPAEQTAFEVVLMSYGETSRLQVIKEIRGIANLALKEAMSFVNELPKVIKDDLSREDADRIKTQVEGVGGVVEIR